jgi:flagellar biogenesis protein FliO
VARITGTDAPASGLAGWLLSRLKQRRRRVRARLALIERISLAPRQSLALIEAEGRRFLVATSADGGQAFYPLRSSSPATAFSTRRVSW